MDNATALRRVAANLRIAAEATDDPLARNEHLRRARYFDARADETDRQGGEPKQYGTDSCRS